MAQSPLSRPYLPPVQSSASSKISTHPTILKDPNSERRFKLGKFLGKGGFATCYLCTDMSSGKEYCCKLIKIPQNVSFAQRNQIDSEKDILRSLNHPNIMKCFGRFTCDGYIVLMLELCNRGTLLSLLSARKRLSELEAKCIAHQFLSALEQLQSRDLLHRDLKLANLLLADGPLGTFMLKIGDFGLAAHTKKLSSIQKWTLCGTPHFIAPEVIDSQGTGSYGFPVDIWSFGVVLYVMLIGAVPFNSHSREEIFRKIKNCEYTFPSSVAISDDAKDLINSILKRDPSQRLSLEKIKQHSFFTASPAPPALPLSSLSQSPTRTQQNYSPKKCLTSLITSHALNTNSDKTPEATFSQKRKRAPLSEVRNNSQLRIVKKHIQVAKTPVIITPEESRPQSPLKCTSEESQPKCLAKYNLEKPQSQSLSKNTLEEPQLQSLAKSTFEDLHPQSPINCILESQLQSPIKCTLKEPLPRISENYIFGGPRPQSPANCSLEPQLQNLTKSTSKEPQSQSPINCVLEGPQPQSPVKCSLEGLQLQSPVHYAFEEPQPQSPIKCALEGPQPQSPVKCAHERPQPQRPVECAPEETHQIPEKCASVHLSSKGNNF